ncbi:MAG: virulence plasmid 65kDa protein, partial [Candidatus Parcubacteria bacterium]
MKLPPSKKVAALLLLLSFMVSFVPPAMAQEVNEVPGEVGNVVIPAEEGEVQTLEEPRPSIEMKEDVPQEEAAPSGKASKKPGAPELDRGEASAMQTNALSSPTSPRNEAFDSRRISLPEVEKNSGALTYRYPLSIPPGRNGLEPALSLSYHSQEGREAGA